MILGVIIMILSGSLSSLLQVARGSFMVIGVGIMLVGFFFTLNKEQQKAIKELPIYEGKEIVGYRRKNE